MKLIKGIVFSLALLGSYVVSAASTTIGIEYLTVEPSGEVRIQVEEDVICNNQYVYFDENMPGFDRVYAMLLEFHMAEKDIRVYYTCEDGKPVVSAIRNAENHNADLY